MHPTFRKLNFAGQPEILVLNVPQSFEGVLGEMADLTDIHRDWPNTGPGFVLAFATRQAEVDALAAALAERTGGDLVAWIAYPKASSKTLKCEFNRDTG